MINKKNIEIFKGQILDYLSKNGPTHIEKIAYGLKVDDFLVGAVIARLESEGKVKSEEKRVYDQKGREILLGIYSLN